MKKKLVVLLVLGYVGGSFSGEPLSPFGPNPFASHTDANSPDAHFGNHAIDPTAGGNPFASHQEEPHREPASPHSEFALPNSSQNPFAQHHEERDGFSSPASTEQQPSFHREHSQDHSLHKNEPLSEVDAEKNPDTGEAAAVDSEVDTFEQEGSGNWLLKRVWWEKTEGVYEQIKQVFNEIMSARMDYISQRNRLDRELDVSYGQIGLEEGELQDIIDYCLDFVKKEKPEQGFLSKQQEDLYNALQQKQHDLEQIKLDLKALQAVDQKIDEALDTLFKQIDVANQYEQKAWDNFKDIARELNDKIARKSYYETEGLLKDIQSVHSYITSQFSSYFNQTLQTARTHSQSISSQVQALKQAGVDLKKEAGVLEQAQEAERLKKELSEHDKEFEAAEKKKEAKKNPKAVPPMGMVSSFISSAKVLFLHIFDRILHAATSFASRIKDWFVKEESVVKAREKTLKLKMEDEKKKAETAVSKEETHVEQVAHKEEQAVKHEEAVLQKSVHEGAAHGEHVITAEVDRAKLEVIKLEDHAIAFAKTDKQHDEMLEPKPVHSSVIPEEENPFKLHHQVEPSAHPVSVMPQDQSQQKVSNPVKTFGPPPTEAPINHPAFSHNPAPHDELVRQGVHPVSPFAK